MLQTILRLFSLIFPHTFSRLMHWYLLLFSYNTGLLDLRGVIIATLPICVYFVAGFTRTYIRVEDDDDDVPPGNHFGPFKVIIECMQYWFFVYKAIDLIAALGVVLRASGVCGKFLLAIDLSIEGFLVLLAKFIFVCFIQVFVGAMLEGFGFAKYFVMELWMTAQLIIMESIDCYMEAREEVRRRNRVPPDNPIHEE